MADTKTSELARRNHGWLFILNEALQVIARPDSSCATTPDDVDELVGRAAQLWSKASTRSELLMMLDASLSARVYPLHGADGSCVLVHLEPIFLRASEAQAS